MPKVAVFLPTMRYGGLDVFEASIKRQTIKPDLIYVADELERVKVWQDIAEELQIKIKMLYPQANLGDYRHLAAAYNEAAFNSQRDNVDLFISLQDYIYAPPNGIERFLHVFEKDPNALVTGLTHISKDPYPSSIVDKYGDYTIFDEPFYGKPLKIDWVDVRSTDIYKFEDGDIFTVYPEHWEANWSAVPVSMFEHAKWNTAYDKGIAYENQDFAKKCNLETGCITLLDLKNVAISLPHKKYWPQEEAEIVKFNNRWLFEAEWA